MRSVALQTVFASLVVLVATGGLTLGFKPELFHYGVLSAGRSTGTLANSSNATSPTAPDLERRASKPASASNAPAFDIVRVEPDGSAVVAGRSTPGVAVELLRGNDVLAREVANQAGEFVIIPPRLPPGSYKLALRAKLPDGRELTSERSVDVQIDARQQPAAVQVANATGQPSPGQIGAKDMAAPVLDPITVDDGGKVTVAGRGRPGSTINVYLNDTLVAAVTPGEDQRFSVTINKGVAAGRYRVRLDQVDPGSGKVLAHTEQPFEVSLAKLSAATPAQPNAVAQTTKLDAQRIKISAQASVLPLAGRSRSHVVVPKIETATVARGDSLWRISRQSYGSGDLYPLILRANRGRIHNPNLIYPSQIFVLPPR